jgi:hypothetical protein
MTSPASTTAATALSRLSDGSWGDPQPISSHTSINDPPVLAYDPAGNLYSAYDTRTYPANETPDSELFGAVAPAGGSFGGQDSQLSQTYGQVGSSPALATAGSGSAIAIWATGVVNGYFAAQASTYGPDSVGSSGSSGASGSSSSSGSGSSTSAGSPGAGSASTPLNPATSARGAGNARRLIITGHARHARAVHVTLMRGQRVYARGSAKPAHGRYRVVLTLVHVPRGRYTVHISLIDRNRTLRQRRWVTIKT